ncbi:MAG: GntR family transcriptional regulator [Devosia sp.]|uniref:GntR family transcriptional regulator n=1 Tax=Devosia sp. TaxID=1871048 RepID=UPI001AC6DD1A|nr:GntR family transcriptional regulator [Devosia sp.]MBN9315738.1 GntR family transcriptional regulator [Devosia sp.]
MRGEIENAGYQAFFDALIDGRLQLGQTLTQDELCRILGISLSPMRETTTLLEAEGLITVRRKVGITIFYPDVKFVGNCFQFRGLLEKEGLRKFAQTVRRDWIDTIRSEHTAIIDFVRQVNDLEAYRVPVKKLERRFHDTFVDAFDNDQIRVNYARLTQKMYLLRLHNLNAVGPANTVTSMEEHIDIIDALKVADVDGAVEALERHLQGVLHRVLTT